MEGRVIRPTEAELNRKKFVKIMLNDAIIAAKNPSRSSTYQIERERDDLQDYLHMQRNRVPRAVPKKKPLSFKRVVETFKNLIMEKPKMVVQGQSPTKSQSSTKSKSPTKSKGGYNSRKYTNITKKPKKEILTKKPKKEL